jgi:hypothetical protein
MPLWLYLRLYNLPLRNHIDAGMSVKHMYVVLLTAAVAAGCLLRLLDGGTAAFGSAADIGETLGHLGAFFALSAIVPSAVVLLRRKPIASTATPTAVGMIVLAAVVYSSYRVLEFQQTFLPLTLPTAVDQSFSPPGCGSVVAFPSKPTINSVIVPGFGELQKHKSLTTALS